MKNNSSSISSSAEGIYSLPENKMALSRSKLEHLKYLAADERMQETPLPDRIFLGIAQALVFGSIGSAFTFSELSLYAKFGCVLIGAIGLVLLIICLYHEIKNTRARKKFRNDLYTSIDEIIKQLDILSAINESKTGV